LEHALGGNLVPLLYDDFFVVFMESHLEMIIVALLEIFDICHLSAIVAHLHFKNVLTNLDSVHQISEIDRSFRKAFLEVVAGLQNALMLNQLEFDKCIFRKQQ
jgi:hypothetical protein